jgi:hypothetical protein
MAVGEEEDAAGGAAGDYGCAGSHGDGVFQGIWEGLVSC